MRGVDLAQLQFDYDLKWAALLLNADGTVYARYGSGSADGAMALNSLAGLRGTLERVLAAHAKYPANRASFAPKRGPKPAYPRAEEIPSDKIRKLLTGDVRRSCIHCHNVYDGLHDLVDDGPDYDPTKLSKYPPPRNVGLELDVDEGTRVIRVLPDSPAASIGIRAGDRIETLGGHAILSIADVQFALHHLPEEAAVDVTLRRGESEVRATLRLSGAWRESDISWRGSMWNLPPGPGLWTEALDDERRKELGIEPGRAALLIRGVFRPEARRAGLRKGDVIVSYDGKSDPLSGPQLAAYIRLNHYRPGARLELEILRDGKKERRTVAF